HPAEPGRIAELSARPTDDVRGLVEPARILRRGPGLRCHRYLLRARRQREQGEREQGQSERCEACGHDSTPKKKWGDSKATSDPRARILRPLERPDGPR